MILADYQGLKKPGGRVIRRLGKKLHGTLPSQNGRRM